VFGYHEVFHAMTVLACGLHYALVTALVRAAG
jgi:predicted membrane channel-forming protein YqfA (hemolysin III family)